MNGCIAGGPGTIGLPLARALRAPGHQVTVLTRTAAKQCELRGRGAAVAVADALDREALMAAVRQPKPTHRPSAHRHSKGGTAPGQRSRRHHRLRIDGTRDPIDSAISVGVRRFVVGSFAPAAAGGNADDRIAAAVR